MRIDQKPDNPRKAAVHVCLAFGLFTLMQALNKLLTGQHNVVEIAFYRNALALVAFFVFVAFARKWDAVKTSRPYMLFTRSLMGATGLLLTFEATQRLPISNATVLFFTATLMAPALAAIFLKEKVGIYRWGAVVVGMSGVLLVAQPSAHMPMIGVAIALGAAVTHALAQILIRSLKTESPLTVTFYFFLGGALIPGLFMPWAAQPVTLYSASILLGIGITGSLGQYFLTTGFQAAQASLLSPLAYTGLLWATLLDVLIWHFVPGWHVYAGGAVIIAANIFILYRERVRARQNAALK